VRRGWRSLRLEIEARWNWPGERQPGRCRHAL